MREHKIEIRHDKCIGCGMFLWDYPAYNIAVKNKKIGKVEKLYYVQALRCLVPESRRFHHRFRYAAIQN